MPELLAVLAGTLAAFIVGSTYYALLVSDDGAGAQPRPWQLGVEVLRCLVLSAVVAGLAAQAEITSAAGGLLLGLALWVGFPLVLWTGAMLWERTPLRQAALHGGDWLLKLLVLGALVSVVQ
jgi:hypothetical protein